MKFASALLVSTALALAACGGGGGSGTAPVTTPPEPPKESSSVGEVQDEARLVALPRAAARGGVVVRYGELGEDPISATVRAFLAETTQDGVVSRFTEATEVRVWAGATAREYGIVREAVAAINPHLPPNLRMQVVPGDNTPHWGAIDVRFLSCAEYRRCDRAAASTQVGVRRDAAGRHVARSASIKYARGTYSHGRHDYAVILMAHELLHALGFTRHVGARFDSIMLATRGSYDNAAPVLAALDREALELLYHRLDPDDLVADLGPWATYSTHLTGETPNTLFGVVLRDDGPAAWATGPTPATTLSRNGALSGAVEWEGALLGLTPGGASVAGDALVGVDLATLSGTAVFDALEQWVGAPGAAGTGALWLDGDLAYDVAVSGNTLRRVGGDAGVLTGVFVGSAHEGATGTLERHDLTAAFGAER